MERSIKVGKLTMGILIAIFSVITLYLLSPAFILYSALRLLSLKAINDYCFKIAVAIDQLGNVMATSFLNDIMIKNGGHKFGDEDETISSVIGRNLLSRHLTIFGRVVRFLLDKIEKNHCINSIERYEKRIINNK